MKNTFQIDFDTKSLPGHIVATQVTISKQVFRAKTQEDLSQSFNIALCDHPLYPRLVRYVQGNPVRKTPGDDEC